MYQQNTMKIDKYLKTNPILKRKIIDLQLTNTENDEENKTYKETNFQSHDKIKHKQKY